MAAQDGHLRLTYKNLIDHFEQMIRSVCQKENTWNSFPVIMGVNAFRGYLDELRHSRVRPSRQDSTGSVSVPIPADHNIVAIERQ